VSDQSKVMTFVERIEGIILHCLVFMLLASVVMGTVELGRSLVVIAMTPPPLMIDPADLTRLFGLFLVILIGLELLKLIKLHMSHDMVRPELVIEVAIIAVCNKVVTLDPKTMTADIMVGLAALLIALAAGFYVFASVRLRSSSNTTPKAES